MWNGYKPTKKERELIEKAFNFIHELFGCDSRIERAAKDEAKGYGIRCDGIPLIGAKALCVKWFMRGIKNPNQYLRYTYMLRPAAIYFMGLGASSVDRVIAHEGLLQKACEAHEAAFKRMHERDLAAIRAMQVA